MAIELHVSSSVEELAHDVARAVVLAARASVIEREIFTLVLSGGQTPEPIYRLLGTEYAAEMPWDKTHLFWGDERAVPPDSEYSNFGMVQNAMVKNVPIPSTNVHRIEAESGKPSEAAEAYEAHMKDVFRMYNLTGFDLCFLGIGSDGHTASLYPHGNELNEKERWVMGTTAPAGEPVRERITLTLPCLNNARSVYFIAAGADKRDVIASIIHGREDPASVPSALISGTIRTVLFTDREGAGNFAHNA